MKKNRQRWKPFREEIANLMRSGVRPMVLLKMYPGIDPTTLCRIRERAELPKFPKTGPPVKYPERHDLARLWKSKGKTYAEIAAHFGVSTAAVAGYLQERDLRKKMPDDRCVDCGRKNVVLDRHHEDYGRKETVLLCKRCHFKRHRKLSP